MAVVAAVGGVARVRKVLQSAGNCASRPPKSGPAASDRSTPRRQQPPVLVQRPRRARRRACCRPRYGCRCRRSARRQGRCGQRQRRRCRARGLHRDCWVGRAKERLHAGRRSVVVADFQEVAPRLGLAPLATQALVQRLVPKHLVREEDRQDTRTNRQSTKVNRFSWARNSVLARANSAIILFDIRYNINTR
jgi:hypothetical protein